MCGIVGFVDKSNQLSEKQKVTLCREMLDIIKYRGYDSDDVYIDGNVVLGHNRLAIMDVSQKSKQPYFRKKDDSLVMSYNGEIYNHLDLREQLKDVEFETNSDTETFFNLYKNIGLESFDLINGMFAVSFYAKPKNEVILAVDTFGIEPLYYVNNKDWFAWSSEIKALKKLLINFQLDDKRVYEQVLFRTVIAPNTLLKNIKRVSPGEIVTFSILKNHISKDKYIKTIKTSNEKIEDLIVCNVSDNLLSDVPVGFQLSGGVDSSLISAIAKEKTKQSDIHSFSIGMKDDDWNEFKYSDLVAKQIGTIHHKITFSHKDFCELLPIATYQLDEPVSYPNTIPMMMLAKEARKYVKVLLSGEGADEIFSGYRRYQKLLNSELNPDDILFSNSFMSREAFESLFNIDSHDLSERETIILQNIDMSGDKKLSLYDIKTFLPSLLLRQDKMGMFSNLENRFPFLNTDIVDKALKLESNQRASANGTKIFLKEFASRYLPDEIVYRKKCGFGLPIKDWLKDKSGLGKYLGLFTNGGKKRNFYNYKNIKLLIEEHRDNIKDHSEVLWILISLEVWLRIFTDGEDHKKIWQNL